MKKYKVLFCDMDGTLIETVSGETFPKGIWDMKFKFDVLDAIKNLNPKKNLYCDKSRRDRKRVGVAIIYLCKMQVRE